MPELPEVQTIAEDLNKKIKGAVIARFWTDWQKGIKTDLAAFKKGISGKKILEVKRRGKNLLFYLSGGSLMHAHLKMTGHLLVKSAEPSGKKNAGKRKNYFSDRVNRYIHHIWYLEKNGAKLTLEFSDLRKFGKLRYLETGELEGDKELNSLGLEPLSEDFTLKKFRGILEKKFRWAIRDILLDQSLVAGIGNIYVSEILFEAGVLPVRRAGDLKEKEIKKIFSAIIRVLKKSVKLRGTSDSDYRDTSGAPGGFQKVLKVYNLEGRPCQRKGCQGEVKREKQKQRSAFFCQTCQK